MSSIIMINKNNENKILEHYTAAVKENKKNHVLLIKEKKSDMKSYSVSLSSDEKISTKNKIDPNKKNDKINSDNLNHSIQKISSKNSNNQKKIHENKKEKDINQENNIKKFIFEKISDFLSQCIKFLKIFAS